MGELVSRAGGSTGTPVASQPPSTTLDSDPTPLPLDFLIFHILTQRQLPHPTTCSFLGLHSAPGLRPACQTPCPGLSHLPLHPLQGEQGQEVFGPWGIYG